MTSSSEDPTIIGFGTNYFHALGGTEATSLEIEQEESDEGLESSTVEARILSDPPWKKNDDTLKQITCSATSTIFLTEEGSVYQCGTLHGRVLASPVRVEVAYPRKCVEVSAGRHFCIGRLENGIGVISWGAGHFGQLGLGNHVSSLGNPQIIPHLLPQALGTSRVQQVAAGAWHALALLDNGKVMAWGSNRKLQCGIRTPQKSPPTVVFPQPIEFYGCFEKVAAGRLHSMGLEKDTGRVYTWGASHYGQCGQYARKSCVAPPRLVEALQRVVVVDIAAGDAHSLGLTGGGRVFVWGSGMDGQLGLGGVIPISRPKLLADLDFVAIEAGREWKQQQQQQQMEEPSFRDFNSSPVPGEKPPVGPPSSYSESPAILASHLSTVPRIVKIEAAGAYSVAVSSSGHLYSWGYNDCGQLGLPRSAAELPLVEVTSSMMKQSSSGRLLQIRSFESQQNVLLPRRVDALANYRVTSVAVGPCNMWCVGTVRPEGETDMVGQTLYEAQEERRRKGLWRLRKNLSSSASASSASDNKMSPTIMSIQAVSRDTVEEIVIPNSVYTHAESTGMDEDGASTTTYETQQSSCIILPVEGEQQSQKQTPPRIQETTLIESPPSGESLTITSVESTPPDDEIASPSSSIISEDKKADSPASPKSPERGVGRGNSLSNFIAKRSKSRKKSQRSRTQSEEMEQEQVNGLPLALTTSTTPPTAASVTSPLGFAGGRPHFAAASNRRSTGRSQSVPSRRSTTPPPDSDGQGSPTSSPERRGIGQSISVTRLMRGRRKPKAPKDEAATGSKKGRVRKALNCAFGGKS